MKKITLFFASLVLCLGAWAQNQNLVLDLSDIPTSYPYELSEEDAAKVFGLTDLTVVVKVNTAELSGRRAIFCFSDPNQPINADAMGKDSHYVTYGSSDAGIAYLASCKTGDRFSKAGIPANTEGVVLAYVINPTANTCKLYVNGEEKGSWVNAHADGFMSGYEIATPKKMKEDYPDTKIYLGGGVKSDNAEFEKFNGTITGVKVYEGALSVDDIKLAFVDGVAEVKEDLNALITEVGAFLNAEEYAECDEITALGATLSAAETIYGSASATAVEVLGAIETLTAAYEAAKEYPIVSAFVKTIEAGDYYIYYTDGEDNKHYLQTAGANSIVTVTENAQTYEISAGTVQNGKFSNAYALKMNNLYISNTSHNATNIETKDNIQLWSSQVMFEKGGKCAIRLTNATAVDGWHGNYFIGKGDTEGTTIALDPTTSSEEAMFIWEFEKVERTELSYTLTDVLGNVYTGVYQGIKGVTAPAISGCTFENAAWNGTAYSANVVFPFPVSDEEITKAMELSILNTEKKWHAIGGDIKVQIASVAEPKEEDLNDWLWAIYPSFADGKFTFVIKNITADKYVYTEATAASHNAQGTLTLQDEGTVFESVSYGGTFSFKVADRNLYLSINSSGDTDVYLGVYGNTHGGTKLYYVEREVSFGTETSIEEVSVEAAPVIYDLTGRRVEKMEKGIYIVNGRKVVIK